MKVFITGILLALVGHLVFAQNMDTYNNCKMVGDVSPNNPKKQEMEDLNRQKNRYQFPTPQDFDHSVTLEKMIGSDGEHDRTKFDTKKAVTIEGYVIYAAKNGSSETCNCHATDPYFTDQHFELALTPDEPKDSRTVIVEITPRLREIMAHKGTDWTNSNMQKYLGHKVRVSGWLFYDAEHEKDACSYHPDKCGDVPGFNRHTCWEIHPITKFEDISGNEYVMTSEDMGEESAFSNATPPPPNPRPSASLQSVPNNPNPKPMAPQQYLILILLGGILGTVGQLLRVIIGLKKAADSNQAIDYKRTSFSLVLSFAIGGVAGVLASLSAGDIAFDKSTMMAFLSAGYAGTDFIEGFMRKNRIGN